jgi:hypothetical protein
VQGQFYRLNRITGESLWRDASGVRDRNVPDVDQFLAANERYIYVRDMKQNLLILDRQRGTVLGSLPIKDFLVSFENDFTDRVYLAAHNGTLICLRDFSLPKPKVHRLKDAGGAPEQPLSLGAPKPKDEKPKDPFKPKDEKPKDEKPKDEKPKDEKPKDEKSKEEKPNEEKPKNN